MCMPAKPKRYLLFNPIGKIWLSRTHILMLHCLLLNWESLVASKGNSIWSCFRLLKHRNQWVQRHTEEPLWRWIVDYYERGGEETWYLPEGSWFQQMNGDLSESQNFHNPSDILNWVQNQLHSLSSYKPKHFPNQVFSCLHVWASLVSVFPSLKNLTIQNFL